MVPEWRRKAEGMEEAVRLVASDRSGRGAPRLARTADYARGALCALSARAPLVVTGFWVPGAGAAETDGPPGAVALAEAFRRLGADPLLTADARCAPVVRACAEAAGLGGAFRVAEGWSPWERGTDLLVYVERLGRSADGRYRNMRGEDLGACTAPLDMWAREASRMGARVLGIGDGGNEVGMGSLAEELLRLVPPAFARGLCSVEADVCLAADVSNWGAYALAGAMGAAARRDLLPLPEEEEERIRAMVRAGGVDGTTKKPVPTVDGFPLSAQREIVGALRRIFLPYLDQTGRVSLL